MVDLSAASNLPPFPGYNQQDADDALARLNAGAPQSHPSWIGGGLSAGVHEMGAGVGGLAQAVGGVTGLQGLAGWGKDVAQSQNEAMEQSGRPDLEGNWTSPGGVVYNLAKMAPSLAAMMTGAGAAGMAARGLGLVGAGARVAGMAGAGAVAYPGAVGGNVQTAETANQGVLQPHDAAKALLMGVPEAAVQSFMPERLENVLKIGAKGDFWKRVGIGAMVTAPLGAVQGGVTAGLTDAMDPSKTMAERAQSVVHAALQGALSGGIAGGLIHGVAGKIKTDAADADLEAAATVPEPPTAPAPLALPAPPLQITDQSGTQPIYVNRLGEAGRGMYEPEPIGTVTGPDGQVRMDLPEQQAPAPSVPLAPEPPAQAEIPNPSQTMLWTPEETGTRAPQIMDMRARLYKIAGRGDTGFIDDTHAATEPELVKQLRDKLQDYWERGYDTDKKPLPAPFVRVAHEFGVMEPTVDATGKEIEGATGGRTPAERLEAITAAADAVRSKAQSDAADAEARARAAYQKTWDNVQKTNPNAATSPQAAAQMVPAQRKLAVALNDAKTIAAAGESRAQAYAAEAAKVQPLVDMHTAADNLPDKFDAQPVPDVVEKAGNASLWQEMQLLTNHADPKIAQAATDARDALRQNSPAAVDAANKVLERYKTVERAKFGKTNPVPQGFLDSFDRTVKDTTVPDTADVHAGEGSTQAAPTTVDDLLPANRIMPETADVHADEASTQAAPIPRGYEADAANRAAGDVTQRDPAMTVATAEAQSGLKPSPEAQLRVKRSAPKVKVPDAVGQAAATGKALKQDAIKTKPTQDEQLLAQREAERRAVEQQVAQTQAQHTASLETMRQRPEAAPLPSATDRKGAILGGIEQAKAVGDAAQAAKLEAQARKLGLLRVSRPEARTQMDADIQHLIQNGQHAPGVLEHIAEHGDNLFSRTLAKALQRLGVKSEIVFGPPEDPARRLTPTDGYGDTTAAGYDEVSDRVHIMDWGDMQANVLHELVHAATFKALHAGTPAATRLQALFEQVKAHTLASERLAKASGKDGAYGLTNLHEFVAEAFTNPWFRDTLDHIPSDATPKAQSVWQKFKAAIFKMLGMPERQRSALDDIMDAGWRAMDENTPLEHPGAITAGGMLAKRIDSETDKVDAVTSRIASNAAAVKDYLLKKADDAGSGPMRVKEKVNQGLNYLRTNTELIRGSARDFASGAMGRLEEANKAHSAIGRAAGTVGLRAKAALDAIKDKATYTSALRDYNWSSQVGSHPFLPFDKQTWLHQRADRALLKPEVDRIAKDFNDKYRQKGAREAIEQLIANHEAQNYSKMLLDLHGSLKTNGFGDRVIGEDAHDRFANLSEAHNPVGARDFYKQALETQVKPLRDYVDAQTAAVAHLDADDGARLKVEAEVKPLVHDLGEIAAAMKKQEQSPYSPSGREGDYVAAFRLAPHPDGESNIDPKAMSALMDELDKAGFNVGVNQHIDNPDVFIRVDSPDKAQQIANIATRLGEQSLLDPDGKEPMFGRIDAEGMSRRLVPERVQKMMTMLAQDTGVPEEHRKVLLDNLNRVWHDMLPAREVVQLNRKNVQGFSTDVGRAIDRRNRTWANTMANLATRERKAAALGMARDDIKTLRRGTDLNQTLRAENTYHELSQREATRDYRPIHTVLDGLRSFVHAWQLGVSPAYFVLEMSQVPMFVAPAMAVTHGYAKTYAALGKATPMTVKVMRAIAQGELGKYGVMTPEGLKAVGVPKDVADFLLEVNNRGWFENSATRELGLAAAGKSDSFSQKALHYANISALYTELATHIGTALAVRELHMQKPYAGGLDAFVDHVMDKGHWNWGPGETSRAMGKQGFAGELTPMVTQFAGWQVRALETYYREIHNIIGGETVADKLEAGKFLAGHLATVIALCGLTGLPTNFLLGLGTKLANTFTGSDQYDFEQSFRGFLADMMGKEFGDAMARGLPHLGGLDLGELGDESLVPFGRFLADQRKWEDASKDLAWRSMGSSVGTLGNMVKSMRDISMGNTMNGIRGLLPATLRNPFEAYQMAQHGYIDQSGDKAPIQPTGADVAMKAVGLEPASAVQNEDLRGQAERTLEMQRYVSGYLTGNLKRASAYGDPVAMQNVMAQIAQYRQQHPGLNLNPGTILRELQHRNALARMGFPEGSIRDQRLHQQTSVYYNPQQ